MGIKLTSHLDGLVADMEAIAPKAKDELHGVVVKNAREGNTTARAFAKVSAGRHGKRYPAAFSTESVGLLASVYGPRADMPQGGMSFERGSRNQKPHLDLARSADLQGPKFDRDVGDVVDRLFW